jgi:hypothetical protein
MPSQGKNSQIFNFPNMPQLKRFHNKPIARFPEECINFLTIDNISEGFFVPIDAPRRTVATAKSFG